jgi:hypothetical protein
VGVASTTSNQAATNATTVLVGATYTIPANTLAVGTVYRVRVHYRFVKTTGPPTLTCNLNFGGASVAQVIITSVNSSTTSAGWLEGVITCITTGSGGTIMSAIFGANNHGISNAINWNPTLTNIATSAADTTTTNVISIDMKMTTAVASNTLTISQGWVELVKT